MFLFEELFIKEDFQLRAAVRRMVQAICLTALTVLSLTVSAQPLSASGTIEGRVQSSDGNEAGVWVIAETDDLPTHFAKIVVTNDEGRFVLPELPEAMYKVWVRGYGLVDSDPIFLRTGAKDVFLRVFPAGDQLLAAQVYPANYWYSLLEVPDADQFPGTGPNGNGISERMRSQKQWIDMTKQGCQLCHQRGNKATRTLDHLSHLGFE
ncbi:MAG: carboxypeptidase-like regulatory domain-containing protein, partial [Pseudomonadales bacterium]|nr:carboxypeptidase-like regulatory domain-containing protein [Pseudomonadales bacterium]